MNGKACLKQKTQKPINCCQVTAIMTLFVERPVASLWRRDAKAGVGRGRRVQVEHFIFFKLQQILTLSEHFLMLNENVTFGVLKVLRASLIEKKHISFLPLPIGCCKSLSVRS